MPHTSIDKMEPSPKDIDESNTRLVRKSRKEKATESGFQWAVGGGYRSK
jgi:hypothetical protein